MSPALSTRLAIVAATLSIAAACGGGGEDRLQMGLKRVALDLAFKAEEDGAQPASTASPRVIFEDTPLAIAPFVPQVEEVVEPIAPLPRPRQGSPAVRVEQCPKAEPGSVPAKTATVSISELPVEGRYDYNDIGTFEVAGPFPFKGKTFPRSIREYDKAEVVPGESTIRPGAPPQTGVGPSRQRFEVFQPGFDQNFVRRNFEVRTDGIFLLRLQVRVGEQEFTFTPSPPVKLVGLGRGPGDEWTSAGTDTSTGTSMVVQGVIEKREVIDVCGEVYDSFRVRSTERIVNLTDDEAFTQFTDDTTNPPGSDGPGMPNIYNVGTQFGGLFLREEVHTVTQIAGFVVSQDNVSTLTAVAPAGPPSGR